MVPASLAVGRLWPSDETFTHVVRAFWLDALQSAKALVRRNIQAAETSDKAMKEALLTVIAWHSHAIDGTDGIPSFEGHLLSEFDDPRTAVALRRACSAFDVTNSWRRLTELTQLFGECASELARLHGYAYPSDLETRVLRAIDPFHRGDGLTDRYGPHGRMDHRLTVSR
ncbi:MAG: aminoglycoside 6-adenylyltransferase [bacterium]